MDRSESLRRLLIALGNWIIAGVLCTSPMFSSELIGDGGTGLRGNGEIVDLVDSLFVTTNEVVDVNSESFGVATAVMVVAAAVGSLAGVVLFSPAVRLPRLWPPRSIAIFFCMATLALVWQFGRASLEWRPSDAPGSGAVGVTSMTILFLAALIRGFSSRPRPRATATT